MIYYALEVINLISDAKSFLQNVTENELPDFRKRLEAIAYDTEVISGTGATAMRGYIEDVHFAIIDAFNIFSETFKTTLDQYQNDFSANVDDKDFAIYDTDYIDSARGKLETIKTDLFTVHEDLVSLSNNYAKYIRAVPNNYRLDANLKSSIDHLDDACLNLEDFNTSHRFSFEESRDILDKIKAVCKGIDISVDASNGRLYYSPDQPLNLLDVLNTVFEKSNAELLKTYQDEVKRLIDAKIAEKRNDLEGAWFNPDFPGLNDEELLQLCKYASVFGTDNELYRAFEIMAINRAYVRNQRDPFDPDKLLTITRDDVLVELTLLERELYDIAMHELKGKDLSKIATEYKIAGVIEVYNRNPVETILSERYDYYKVGAPGYAARGLAFNTYYKGEDSAGYHSLDGDSGNALQHAYWSSAMTDRLGSEAARLFGIGHEAGLDMSNTTYMMDLENNMRGRNIPMEKKEYDSFIGGYITPDQIIIDMTNNGELVKHAIGGSVNAQGELVFVVAPPEDKTDADYVASVPIQRTDGNACYHLYPDLPKNNRKKEE